jgi:tetratricopeptide (TPR) repeat protein
MRALIILVFLCGQLQAQSPTIEQAKKHFETGKYAEAKKILEPIDDDSKDYGAAQYYLGRISFEEKNYDDAADYFDEATEASPKVAEYYVWLGDTYGTIAQDANVVKQGILAPKMRSAWESAIVLDPKNLNARESLVQYYCEAPGFMGGSFEKAHGMADQLIALSPAVGHREKGSVYVREKKFA